MSDIRPHAEELARLGDPSTALGVLDLVFSTPDWIHRRVERVDIVTSNHVRRHVSLDVTLPPHCATVTWFDDESYALVPVDAPAKTSLVDFDIRDENGLPLPVLTQRQNGEVAWRGMVEYACSLIRASSASDLPEWTIRGLRRITQCRTAEALRALRALHRLANLDPTAALLVEDEGFSAAAEMLARNFLLIAFLPARPGSRRILKYSFEEGIPPRDQREPGEGHDRRGLLGREPVTIELPVPSFMDCESFHFEASAPTGIELIDIVLGDEHPSRRKDGSDERWTLGYRWVLGDSPHRAHLATSRTAHSEALPDEFIDPRVSVRLRADRTGWLRASTLAATLVLTFFVISLPYVVGFGDGRSPTTCVAGDGVGSATRSPELRCEINDALSTDPAAFSVALLSILSFVLIRPGEHAYTEHLLRRPRLIAIASALLPLAGAWLLVFPGPGRLLDVGWSILAVTSSGLTGALWISYASRVPR